MSISMVCESSAGISTAIRSSISSSNDNNNQHHHNQLLASAKRALLAKIEYEESLNRNVNNDALKSKYIVLKAATTNGTNAASPVANVANKTVNLNGSTIVASPSASSSASSPAAGRDAEFPTPKMVLYPRNNVQIGWKSSARKWSVGSGMINVGNTCYLNSTLQALFHVPAFANWLLSDAAHRETCEAKTGIQGGCIICAMAKTLLASQQNQQQAIKPYLVYSKLRMVCKHLIPGQQEDAHEYLRYLMEAMEKAFLNRYTNNKQFDQHSKETTPINQILGGYLKTSVRCLSCHHVSVTFQHFEDLLLDIRQVNTVEEALDMYFASERLEDMGYKCEGCKKKVSATKQFSLERAPITLCIQLKRFTMAGNKINKHIGIRERLNLSKYSSKRGLNKTGEQLSYRLVAMVTHLGASQHCGHYTAIGLTDSGTYYQFDDSYVRPIALQNVLNTNTYIIFYELEANPTQPTATWKPQQTISEHKRQPLEQRNGISAASSTTATSSPSPSPSLTKTYPSTQTSVNGGSPSNLPLKQRIIENNSSSSTATSSNKPAALTPKPSNHNDNNNGETKSANRALGTPKTTPSSTTSTPEKRRLVPYTSDEDDSDDDDKNAVFGKFSTAEKVQSSKSGPFQVTSTLPLPVRTITERKSASPTVQITSANLVQFRRNNSDSMLNGSTASSFSRNNGKSDDKKPSMPIIAKYNTNQKRIHSPMHGNGQETDEPAKKLLKMSHRGYGINNVLNWNGGTSVIDHDVVEEKKVEQARQSLDANDAEMDRGHTKKIKTNNNNFGRANPGYNPFTEQQIKRNSWNGTHRPHYHK